MNWPLLRKNVNESRLLLAGCAVLLFGFQWLRVWLIGQLPLARFKVILSLLPNQWERLSPIPFDQIATSRGRIAMAFDEPLVVIAVTVWAVARGSDAVSGEIGRGTMEMLLAQPVRRVHVLATQGFVTIMGAVALAAASWLGLLTGLSLIEMEEPVTASIYLPCVLNLFSLTVCMAGLSTLASSWDRYRWRTIGIMGSLYAFAMVTKAVGRLAANWHWLSYLSFFTPYESQLLVARPQAAWTFWTTIDGVSVWGGLGYDALLLGVGLLGYLIATVVFSRRDLPAPL